MGVFSFVDRDMFMRFRGGGVGHRSTQNAFEHVVLDDEDDVQEEDPTVPEAPGHPSPHFSGAEGEDEELDEDEEDAEMDYGYNADDADIEGEMPIDTEGMQGDGVHEEEEEMGVEDGEDGIQEDELSVSIIVRQRTAFLSPKNASEHPSRTV